MIQNPRCASHSWEISNVVKRIRTVTIIFLLSVLSIYLAGCGDKFFDPTQLGRFRPVPAVNVILDSLGVAEETASEWEGAEDPRPIDVIAYETEHTFAPGDIIRIYIYELLQNGRMFGHEHTVTETGKISITEVGDIEVTGLTESQLEEEIKQILSPSILKDPLVTVTLVGSPKRMFSILGAGVGSSGRFYLPRYDFRLTDAIAAAGGISQFNVSYIYVSRTVTGKETIAEPIEPELAEPERLEQLIEPDEEMLEIIAPRATRQWPLQKQGLIIASAEKVTDKELAEAALPDGFEPLANDEQDRRKAKDVLESPTEPSGRETIDAPINQKKTGRIEWIFQDGKWFPVQVGRPEPMEPARPKKAAEPLEEELPEAFDWNQIGAGGVQTRVIKIPTDKLIGGDPRYNIAIRSGDSIQIPVDIVGEFCIMGNVNAQGYVNLTGRPMTLKMAIAAVGGLGPLAWPKQCEVIRRIGKEKEETVMVDLDKIARGEQPDFFIKPNDLINVGTHPTARWRAVLRNAFRATYGFGFIYDRNFADRDYGTRRPIPHWF